MKPASVRTLLASLVLFGTAALAASVEEKYDDGKLKAKFSVDTKGRKDGLYQEFYPGGKIRCQAYYKADQLNGTYTEFDPKGKKTLAAVYKDGKLSGTLQLYDKGLPTLSQPFKDGEPVFPKSREKIAAVLKELLDVSKSESAKANPRELALRRLKSYRFLADVPYQDLKLDDQYNRQAQAASEVCNKLGKLSHNPPNPGMPPAVYKLGLEGARHANLGGGVPLLQAVDMWVFDSDPGNVQTVGHRRWCLNPAMGKVGFGEADRFTAMYAHDQSQKKLPDFDYVCYPPRGFVPVGPVNAKMAWCFCPNPRKFKAPDAGVKARVTAIDENFRKQGEPLTLNYHKVDTMPVGMLPYCVIFRPEHAELSDGKRYLVEIEGLKSSTGRPVGIVAYPVAFFELK